MSSLGTVVHVGDLLQVAWTSAAAGVGVTCAYALAILGTTRAMELQRDDRPSEASVFAVLGLTGLAVVGAALVFGIVVMTAK